MPSNDKPWDPKVGPTATQLAAYTAEERAKIGEVVEAWTIVDKWWTEDPIRIEYRQIMRDGKSVIQRLSEGEWFDYEPTSTSPTEGDPKVVYNEE